MAGMLSLEKRTLLGMARDHAIEHRWRDGCVYFIGAGGRRLRAVKIGWTGGDVRKRFATLSTASADPLVLLGVLPGPLEREARLHARYHSARMRGEWFRPIPELLEEVDLSMEKQRLYPATDDPAFAVAAADCELCQAWDELGRSVCPDF